MKSFTTLAVTLVFSAASAGQLLASGDHGQGEPATQSGAGMPTSDGGHGMQQMMTGMHGGKNGNAGMGQMRMMGHGMMQQGMMGHGMAGHGGLMSPLMANMLSDGNGKVTAGEAQKRLTEMHVEYDADGDGTLSIAEFEKLHSSLIREMMVDRFQHLDADGDGMVTTEEMTAPTEKMKRMQMPGGHMQGGSEQGAHNN